MTKRAVISAVCAISTLFAFQGSALTFADEIEPVTATTNFTLTTGDPVLEITVPTNPTILDLTPTTSGTAFGSVNVNVKVATNNLTGYTLTMTASPTALTRTETIIVSGEETTPTIPTLSSTTTEANFPADKWGYKITGETYNPITTPAIWATEAPANSTDNIVTLAAKVSTSTPSGTYQTTLNYQAVTNAVVGKDIITFDSNNADGGTTMSGITVEAGTSSSLPANTYTYTGMRFVGWSSSDGKVYADESTYTAPDTGINRHITLTAQWVPSSTPTPSGSSAASGTTFTRAYEIAYTAMHKGMYEKDESEGGDGLYHLINSWPPDNEEYHNYDVRFAMQDMTPEICASVTVIDDAYRALDTRDNSLYFITKLQDGKCWMTENLDLDLSSSKALTNQDTDLNDKTTWTPTTIIPSTNIDSQYGGISGFSGSQTSPVSVDAGEWWSDLVWTDECTSSGFLKCSHFNQTAPSTLDDAKHHGHVGNYYNWPAAIAETSTTADRFNTDGYNAPNSICPKGWRLPIMVGTISGTTINATQEFAYMNKFYDTKNNTDQGVFGAPVYLIRFGKAYYELSYANKGYYWSATARSGIAAHYASITSGYGPSGDTEYSDKSNAQPVRCIAR